MSHSQSQHAVTTTVTHARCRYPRPYGPCGPWAAVCVWPFMAAPLTVGRGVVLPGVAGVSGHCWKGTSRGNNGLSVNSTKTDNLNFIFFYFTFLMVNSLSICICKNLKLFSMNSASHVQYAKTVAETDLLKFGYSVPVIFISFELSR